MKTISTTSSKLAVMRSGAQSLLSPYLFTRYLLAVLLLGIMACASGSSSGGDDDDDGGSNGGSDSVVEQTFRIDAVTNGQGIAEANFELAEGTSKFAVTAYTPSSSNQVRFAELFSSSGVNYLDPSGQMLSFADFFFSGVNSVNAPSRNVDPNLSNGDSYTVVAEAINSGGSPLANTNIQFLVSSRRDSNLSGGRLRINLYFVGEIADDSSVRQVMDIAMQEFRDIYSSALGISLDVQTFEIEGPLVLPSPFDGNSLYESASSANPGLGVNIFIGGDVAGSSGGVLGIAGGIIAPPTPSRRSGLAISIFTGAGVDGVYDQTDLRILGETLAHETGHYAGLFHPVDFSGDVASATDPLSDTASCGTFVQCLANDDLVRNLMFTTPVSDGSGGFFEQNQLTDQQRAVINRYTAVE